MTWFPSLALVFGVKALSLAEAPGVYDCNRYRLASSNAEGMARYTAVYYIDSPERPSSDAWLAESEKGEWPTKNRWHSIFKHIG